MVDEVSKVDAILPFLKPSNAIFEMVFGCEKASSSPKGWHFDIEDEKMKCSVHMLRCALIR